MTSRATVQYTPGGKWRCAVGARLAPCAECGQALGYQTPAAWLANWNATHNLAKGDVSRT